MKRGIKLIQAVVALMCLAMMSGSTQAAIITECYTWVPIGSVDVTNDCYLEIFNEPVVPGVDRVYTRTDVGADVYHGATYRGYFSAWDADAADYPGTVTYNGYPFIEIFSAVGATVRHGPGIPPTVDTGFDPFCIDGTFSYREFGVTLVYTTRSMCGGFLGFSVVW
jgi:hypothetical protein